MWTLLFKVVDPLKKLRCLEILTTGINSEHLFGGLAHLSNTGSIFCRYLEFIDEARTDVCDSPLVSWNCCLIDLLPDDAAPLLHLKMISSDRASSIIYWFIPADCQALSRYKAEPWCGWRSRDDCIHNTKVLSELVDFSCTSSSNSLSTKHESNTYSCQRVLKCIDLLYGSFIMTGFVSMWSLTP